MIGVARASRALRRDSYTCGQGNVLQKRVVLRACGAYKGIPSSYMRLLSDITADGQRSKEIKKTRGR